MYNKVYDKIKKYIKENLWFVISLIAIILLFTIELPYQVETPGGFISLNDRIKVEGQETTSGEFGMAYVSMIKGNIPFILFSYINNDWDVIKKDKLTYDNESLKEMTLRERLNLNEAISNATISAYNLAGKDVKIKKQMICVAYNDNENSDLKVGDIILKINDVSINTLKDIQDYIQTLDINDIVNVNVLRDNKEITVTSTLKEYENSKKMGVSIIYNYELETNPNIEINSKSNESGPSGGLMMALGIYDKLTSSNLTKGDKIIGTGTIDNEGNVGEIGGVKYKLIGAVKSRAKIFLCPKENYEEAITIAKERNYDIIIKSVETLSDAINYLKGR
ncbi:MAG: PDZ domain-containing protein [Bacilli bacterium]|nr:PDZ domain-containing protein [Bacilli bacterium]